MGDLVNRQEQVLVRCPSNHIRRQHELPRERMRLPQQHGARRLQRNDRQYDPLCPRRVPHETLDLRMGLEDLKPARAMGLFGHRPEEVGALEAVDSEMLVLGFGGGREVFALPLTDSGREVGVVRRGRGRLILRGGGEVGGGDEGGRRGRAVGSAVQGVVWKRGRLE
jgi:hypothetical protein